MAVTTSVMSAKAAATKSSFRSDVQGLRAVAVVVVLLFHANAPFLTGGYVGVDIFFVISGFLITGILVKEITATGALSLSSFYARRARRILPAASVVLVAVIVLMITLLPETRWKETAQQVLGSAFYVVNWVLAGSVNYLNATEPATAVQHFWSLAVEEQFYIVWPLILVIVVALSSRRSRRSGHRRINASRARTLTVVGVLLVTVPSLIFSVTYSASDPGPAYFATTTRLWELGIGAVVAVCAAALATIPRAVRSVVGALGLIAIVTAAVFYTPATSFPGYAALLPTLGAAGVIVGGMGGLQRSGVEWLLSLRPVTWIGDISYSLYLWHWPLIVVVTYLLGGLAFWQGAIVVVLSIIPAYLSYRFIERPFQAAKWAQSTPRVLQVGLIMMSVTGLVAMSVLLIPKPASPAVAAPVAEPTSVTDTAVPALGAQLFIQDPKVGAVVDSVASFTPSALDAADDNPSVYADGCHLEANEVEVKPCTYGSSTGSFRVALIGDSHAAQWVPALQAIANQKGWQLKTYTKSSCPLADTSIAVESGDAIYKECDTWNVNMLAALKADPPDLVITSSILHIPVIDGKRSTGQARINEMGAGFHRTWSALQGDGIPVVSIADTPFMAVNVPECVSAHETHLSSCAVSAAKALAGVGKSEAIGAKGLTNVSVINLDDDFCTAKNCAAVVGNVLVYRDDSHMTATYSKTLAPALLEQLEKSGASD